MNQFLEKIDQYCERTGPDFFSEPINAITNLSFIIATLLLYSAYKKSGLKDSQISGLISLIAIIGLGSFAFHTWATYLAMLADVIPIMFFVFYFLWVAFRVFFTFSKLQSAFGLLLFFGAAASISQVPAEYNFNGSIAYFPCLAALLLLGVILKKRAHPAAGAFFKAGGLFALSLTFRSIDEGLCPSFPIGTHFMWHVLNGAVLYFLARSVLNHKIRTNPNRVQNS